MLLHFFEVLGGSPDNQVSLKHLPQFSLSNFVLPDLDDRIRGNSEMSFCA